MEGDGFSLQARDPRAEEITQAGKSAAQHRSRVYDGAVREALTIVWEAVDRICGKRLRKVIAGLLEAMQRHGHLQLDAEVRERLLSMSAATMDRLLQTVRERGREGVAGRASARHSVRASPCGPSEIGMTRRRPIFEMDMVAHCGKSMAGSHVHHVILMLDGDIAGQTAAHEHRREASTAPPGACRRAACRPTARLAVDAGDPRDPGARNTATISASVTFLNEAIRRK